MTTTAVKTVATVRPEDLHAILNAEEGIWYVSFDLYDHVTRLVFDSPRLEGRDPRFLTKVALGVFDDWVNERFNLGRGQHVQLWHVPEGPESGMPAVAVSSVTDSGAAVTDDDARELVARLANAATEGLAASISAAEFTERAAAVV